MKMKRIKNLIVTVIALGLSLNGLCMNLIAPKTAMALAMGTSASAMHESVDEMHESAPVQMHKIETKHMATAESLGICGNMNMNSTLNCCLVPMSHGNDKSSEVKTAGETRQHMHVAAVKVETSDIFKTGGSNRLRHFHHSRGPAPSSNLTGEIVKRE